MKWVEWVLEALSSGSALGSSSLQASAARRRVAEVTSSVAEFDHSMAAASRPSTAPPRSGTLASTLSEVVRQTHDPAGRMTLALHRAPAAGRPAPDDAVPEYFEEWLPSLPLEVRCYAVMELAVHVLAAEVRARRAGSVSGVSRPQDLQAVLLLFREALRFSNHSARYLPIARRELRGAVSSLPVAASLIRSAMCAGPSRRFYRTPEIVLALLEAEAGGPGDGVDLAAARRAAAEVLGLEADRLAAAWMASQRWALVARAARNALGPPLTGDREAAWAWTREALSAAEACAAEVVSVGRRTSDQRLRDEMSRHLDRGPAGTTVEQSWERIQYAASFCKRATSELKIVASEASTAVGALRSQDDVPKPRSSSLRALRASVEIP